MSSKVPIRALRRVRPKKELHRNYGRNLAKSGPDELCLRMSAGQSSARSRGHSEHDDIDRISQSCEINCDNIEGDCCSWRKIIARRCCREDQDGDRARRDGAGRVAKPSHVIDRSLAGRATGSIRRPVSTRCSRPTTDCRFVPGYQRDCDRGRMRLMVWRRTGTSTGLGMKPTPSDTIFPTSDVR